jgi:hypothetical protein
VRLPSLSSRAHARRQADRIDSLLTTLLLSMNRDLVGLVRTIAAHAPVARTNPSSAYRVRNKNGPILNRTVTHAET